MKENDLELPKVFSPEEVARHYGWSPRKVRQKVRKIGACRILGNRMVMTEADVALLLEAAKPAPHPTSTSRMEKWGARSRDTVSHRTDEEIFQSAMALALKKKGSPKSKR